MEQTETFNWVKDNDEVRQKNFFCGLGTFVEGDFGFAGGAARPGGLDVVVVPPGRRRLTRKRESRVEGLLCVVTLVRVVDASPGCVRILAVTLFI